MPFPRRFLAIVFAAGLSAWASAQHAGTGPSAAEELKLFQNNQELMQGLLADGLRLSRADTMLARAAECHQAAKTVAAAIEKTASSPTAEPQRIAELGEHFTKIVEEGLAPTLAEARQRIAPGSQEYPRLVELHELLRGSINELQLSLPRGGPIGQAAPVVSFRAHLTKLSQSFDSLSFGTP